jgi:hypothetical protein
MGGHGSGSRGYKKQTVEECLSLHATKLCQGRGASGNPSTGLLTFRNSAGRVVAEIPYESSFTSSSGSFRFSVFNPISGLPSTSVVDAVTSEPFFGGTRWWLVCPGRWLGDHCRRRCALLYLPLDASRFACRLCHDLTYRSSQKHDKRIDFYRRNPDAALKLLESHPTNFSKLFLVLRAFPLGNKPRQGVG